MQARLLRTANFRFTLLYAAVFSVSVLVLVVLIFYSVRTYLEQQARAHISFEVAQLVGDYSDDGIEELRHDIRERIDASPGNRLQYSVQHHDGRRIFDRLPLRTEPGWHHVYNKKDGDFVLHITQLSDGYQLVVAADLGLIHTLADAIRNQLLFFLAFVMLVAVIGGLLVSRRFLARVDHLGTTAEKIGQGQLSARIPLRGSDDDFDHLATTINRMLDRIEQLLGEVQHVSTAIAHDLRTPLSQLRLKLEQLRASSGAQADEAIALLDHALETFSALLRIAEIESGSRRSGFRAVDFSALLAQLGEVYQPVAEQDGQQLLQQIAPGIGLQGDQALLTQCFANLIENALRHSNGRSIHLTLAREGQQIVAEVADDGEGIPEHSRELVLRPFYRADASRSRKGNGLGLSLVRAIATLHDARLELTDHAPGLRVRLYFTAR